jgi:hypothetical protein
VAAGKEQWWSGKEVAKRSDKGEQEDVGPRINSYCRIFRMLNGRSERTHLRKAQQFIEGGVMLWRVAAPSNVKVTLYIYSHEDVHGKLLYNSTLSLTSALVGVGC